MVDLYNPSFKVVNVYRYSHTVTDILVQSGLGDPGYDELTYLWETVVKMAKSSHNYQTDNKTVIAIQCGDGKVYIGMFDWTISIGLGVQKW